MKSVLVTGASTGLGLHCSVELAKNGWRVFAGFRKESDADKLRELGSGNLTPVLLDVTDYETVHTAVAVVRDKVGDDRLDGLVNNAGISIQGPLEFLPIETLEKQLAVNVTGQVAVTQACLPLIRRAKGRIVFMSSESGRFTIPMTGPYSASKFALEAIANAFRMELLRSGIKVSLIEPGSIKSDIWDKAITAAEELRDSLPAEARELYGTELNALIEGPKEFRDRAIPAHRVTRAVLRALTSRWPRARYVVSMEARLLILFHRLTPTFLSDRIKIGLLRKVGLS